jgi:hypothetical protein
LERAAGARRLKADLGAGDGVGLRTVGERGIGELKAQ